MTNTKKLLTVSSVKAKRELAELHTEIQPYRDLMKALIGIGMSPDDLGEQVSEQLIESMPVTRESLKDLAIVIVTLLLEEATRDN